MDLVAFHDTLLASSIFLHKTDKSPMILPTTRRHRFLNGLALLLSGSESCTSVYPWLQKRQLLIARNKPLKSDDEIYFNRFFGLIRIYSRFCLTSDEQGMTETHSILESTVFEYNKDKCIKRILNSLFDDTVSKLQKLLIVNIDRICENITVSKLTKGSADYTYLRKRKMPLKEYITKLFTWINRILLLRESIRNDKKNLDLRTIEKFQQCSELLYSPTIFRSIVLYQYPAVDDCERIQYYIDKTSAHIRSLSLLLLCLQKRTSEYGEIYKNMQWYFIEPIQFTVNLEKPLSLTFDQIWKDCNLPEDQEKTDFKRQYIGDKFLPYDSSLKLSTSLHSEIRIIDYLIAHNIHEVHDGDVEIGISKLSCYPCSLYIEQLNQKFNRKFCTGDMVTHGKIYPNWAFRSNEDETIRSYVNVELYKLIKKELIEWGLRTRTKSGDSDKLETEPDDDDLDDKYITSRIDNFQDQ